MTILIMGFVAAAVGTAVVLGARSYAPSRPWERRKSLPQPRVTPETKYFERYMPRRTSGQGEAL